MDKYITSLTDGLFQWGKVKGDFNCSWCDLLESLKGVPEVVERVFSCRLTSITSLEGCPKVVGGNFVCNDCETVFTEEDVRKVSKVKGDIIV